MVAGLGAAFFAGAAFLAFGASFAAVLAVARRGRPAAAVASISFPLAVVIVAGGSAAEEVAFAGVAFALVFAFFGGIFARFELDFELRRAN